VSLFGNCRSSVTLFSTQIENVNTPRATREVGPKMELVARLLPQFAHLATICSQPGIKVINPDGSIAIDATGSARFGADPIDEAAAIQSGEIIVPGSPASGLAEGVGTPAPVVTTFVGPTAVTTMEKPMQHQGIGPGGFGTTNANFLGLGGLVSGAISLGRRLLGGGPTGPTTPATPTSLVPLLGSLCPDGRPPPCPTPGIVAKFQRAVPGGATGLDSASMMFPGVTDPVITSRRTCGAGRRLSIWGDCWPTKMLPAQFRMNKSRKAPFTWSDAMHVRKAAAATDRLVTLTKKAGAHASRTAPRRRITPAQARKVLGATAPVALIPPTTSVVNVE